MKRYDPAEQPDPTEWLALDEQERLRLVEAYHRHARIRVPKVQLHATFHVIVENQVALGDELPVRRAVRRLMDEGLDRHDAIHAVGAVVTDQMFEIMRGKELSEEKAREAYNTAVERLTAESWRKDYGDEEP
jgi:hypothetical protein